MAASRSIHNDWNRPVESNKSAGKQPRMLAVMRALASGLAATTEIPDFADSDIWNIDAGIIDAVEDAPADALLPVVPENETSELN